MTPERFALARAIIGAIDWLAARRVRVPADLAAFKLATVQMFADPAPALRGADAGRKPKAIAAVNAYQKDLQSSYDAWADDLADELADADESDRDDIIAAAVAALILLLKKKGAEKIPAVAALGAGGSLNAGAQALADKVVADNDAYLDGLGVDLKAKLAGGFADPDIVAAIGAGAGAAALKNLLDTAAARVASYAGAAWGAYNQTLGQAAQESGKRIRWVLDEQAQHCEDCLQFGDREYDSYEALLEATGGVTPASGTACGSNCRCELQELD